MNTTELRVKCGGLVQYRRTPQSLALQLAMAASLGLLISGCGGTSKSISDPASQNPSQLYFAPTMGDQIGSPSTYALDHTAGTFVRSTYSASGATIMDAGVLSTSDGIDALSVEYIYSGNGDFTSNAGLSGSWAVDLPGQAALVQIDTPPEGSSISAVNHFTPAAPTESCPSLTTAETFQFVTIPKQLAPATQTTIGTGNWDPTLETAYGSVQISTSGTAVTFNKVTQNTLPAGAGGQPGTPEYPAPSGAISAVCAPTYYGQVISVPGTMTVSSTAPNTVTATIGVGPSGFLVEDAGSGGVDPTTGLSYENILGAGYGAVGLPQPSSDITSSLTGAQYQGFLYAPGGSGFNLISSFGGLQNACNWTALLGQSTAPSQTPSSNTIYGGDYGSGTNGSNDPTSGKINCDIAIDLGTPSANGLYTNATIYVGSSFPENTTGALYYFQPAVAVAGQLQGKNAIFLIGADTAGTPSRAWGIYLLQPN
jgi:hypothetical protein